MAVITMEIILMKTYRELMTYNTYEERLKYLQTHSTIGEDVFGSRRHLCQAFYRSNEWKNIRRKIIIRDKGCDLGLEDYPIAGRVIVHHIEPITIEDIVEHNIDKLLNPNNLICISHLTHEALHYGSNVNDPNALIERSMFDTCPWKIQ